MRSREHSDLADSSGVSSGSGSPRPDTCSPSLQSNSRFNSNKSTSGVNTASSAAKTNPKGTSTINQRRSLELEDYADISWFKANVPRDVALEVLRREPVGSFMVRESESVPGQLALSLRVPGLLVGDGLVSYQDGLVHYIIQRSSKGVKIKGFLKVHRSLSELITHHSVMKEMLPVPLSLQRYNPVYSDHHTDYQPLADILNLVINKQQ